jgi:hypothetical protein
MELICDPDVQAVLEFMQERIPACRLVASAEGLPQLARLLWGHFPQESCRHLRLEVPKLRPLQSVASESSPGPEYADDGSAAAGDGR